MKFQLSNCELSEKPIAYKIPYIEEKITLLLRPATQANKPFFNAQMLAYKQDGNRKRIVNATTLDETRDKDRNLYAKYVVVDWTGVSSTESQPVPFSVENCLDFLNQLPDWLFDDLRIFAMEPSNFLDIEIEGIAKNS